MAPRFIPAQTPQDFSFIPKSIDNIFDRFLQLQKGRMEKEELGIKRGQSLLDTGGIDVGQITPEIAQRAAGAAERGGIQIGQAPEGLGGLEEAVTRFMTQKSEVRGLGIREKEARIGALEKRTAGLHTPEQITDLARRMIRGDVLHKDFKGRGQTALGNKILIRALELDPEFDVGKQVAIRSARTAEARAASTGSFNKQWVALNKGINPNSATASSNVGIAGRTNIRANRAKAGLNKPADKITNQDIDRAIVDLAAIMAGGVPSVGEIEGQSYRTARGKIAEVITFWKGAPTAANIPQVVDEINRVINDIIEVDDKVITDNLDSAEIANEELIARNPARWGRLRASVEKTLGQAQESQGKTSGLGNQEVITRTLKDGTSVQVRRLPDGSFEEVE